MSKHGLDRNGLLMIAKGGPISPGFRGLMKEYKSLAEDYRQKTFDCIRAIWPYLEPRYQLSLEIIFELYLMVFEKIDVENGKFTTEELNATHKETKDRVHKTILSSRTIKI
jgi:hypothetical protein